MLLTDPEVSAFAATWWRVPLNRAMVRRNINTFDRVTMFLAQCAHESGGFTHLAESLKYSASRLLEVWPNRFTVLEAQSFAMDEQRIAERAYGGRMGNGPEGSGDGYRYRGRGILQLTGKYNYEECGRALSIDLVSNPDLLLEPDAAAHSAAWFWESRGCNLLADDGNFEGVTKKINGGLNGLADRKVWLTKIRGILLSNKTAVPTEDKSTPSSVPTQPEQESTMGSLLDTLGPVATAINPIAGILLSAFTPFLKEKLTKEIDRHSDTPGIGEQVSTVLLDAAIKATGKTDPLEAVAVARQDPALMAKVEASATEWLAQMAPLLDKMASMEQAKWKAIDDSADKAAVRGQKDKVDLAPVLVKQSGWAFTVAGVAVVSLIGGQMYVTGTGPDPTLTGFLGILIYGVVRMMDRPSAYRFGGAFESDTTAATGAVVKETIRQQKGV